MKIENPTLPILPRDFRVSDFSHVIPSDLGPINCKAKEALQAMREGKIEALDEFPTVVAREHFASNSRYYEYSDGSHIFVSVRGVRAYYADGRCAF